MNLTPQQLRRRDYLLAKGLDLQAFNEGLIMGSDAKLTGSSSAYRGRSKNMLRLCMGGHGSRAGKAEGMTRGKDCATDADRNQA